MHNLMLSTFASGVSIWAWAAFLVFIVAMLVLDMKVFRRTAHEVKMREALLWSAIWIAMALVFNAGVYYFRGRVAALEFLTGYLVEKSLSVDNLFVFLMIFTFFRVPGQFHHKILFWGILGALVTRGFFIFFGIALINKFEWIVLIFGGFLIYTGVKMAFGSEPEIHPDKSRILRLVQRVLPVKADFEGGKFFVRSAGRTMATLTFLVLVFVETTDVLFAVDSIPAILAITKDPFIVFTSNVFAIFGLRALYFAVAGLMRLFHYLNYGLALILAFVGVKMILSHWGKDFGIGISLGVIGGVLAVSMLASVIWPKEHHHN